MTVESTQALLQLIEKSRLLDSKQLAQTRQAAGDCKDALALAKALVRQERLTRWQAGQLLAGRSSFFLGKYRLVELLGRGGMGAVFLAHHTTMNRPVALKVISKKLGSDPASLERFFTEAQAIAALDHPNIVRAYDVDSEGQRYFIVMEFVQGDDLDSIVASDGPLDPARAAEYIRQAAEGLAHAHQRKMIHCDIKPANLIVNADDVVKILDMGMARLMARGCTSENDSDQRLLGTVDYLAPEQALESPELDHRADIYSLGCTFYYLLTGHPPFPQGTLHERIMKHQESRPAAIAQQRPETPDEVIAVCEKMMAKSPGDRYQTAEEVAAALDPWAESYRQTGREVAMAIVEPADDLVQGAADEDDSVQIEIAPADSFSLSQTAISAGRGSGSPLGAAARLAAFWADPKGKIAAATVGGVALLACVVGIVLMLAGSGDQPAPSQVAQAAVPAGTATKPTEEPAFPQPEQESPAAAASPPAGPSEPKPAPAKTPETPKPKPPAPSPPAGPSESKPAPAKKPEAPKPKPPAAPATSPPAGQSKPAPTKKPAPAKKPEAPKPKPPPDPLQGLPEMVALPELLNSDGPGKGSRSPMSLGQIRTSSDVNWQLLLLGGDTALKGKRKFVLLRDSGTGPAWTVRLEGGGSNEQASVARIWREKQHLMFQWEAEAQAASANYLRNCILQARVAGKTKYVTLTKPVAAEPIVVDLVRGLGNSVAAIKWAPPSEQIRVKITKFEGRQGYKLQPEEPVPPKTPINLVFIRKDRHENEHPGVVFRVLPLWRRSGVSVELRLTLPDPRDPRGFHSFASSGFTEQQLGVVRDRTANQRDSRARAEAQAKGGERDKIVREVDELDVRIWYLDFFLEVHQQGKLYYQVFSEVDGHEVVLAAARPG